MGRNLQVVRIPKFNTELTQTRSYYITVEVEDLADHSPHIIQTMVSRCFPRNGACLVVNTEICRLKPKTPGKHEFALLREEAIDELYKARMPDFLSKIEPDDKLRFYEVQEQDICENDWLRLYTDFSHFCIWMYNQAALKSTLPVEIKKIVVETFETHREPRLKLKSNNAIFHIEFSGKSDDYRSVVRRTTDWKTGHIVLEINSWID